MTHFYSTLIPSLKLPLIKILTFLHTIVSSRKKLSLSQVRYL